MIWPLLLTFSCTSASLLHCRVPIQATKPMEGPLVFEDMTNDPATPRGTFTTGPQPLAILAWALQGHTSTTKSHLLNNITYDLKKTGQNNHSDMQYLCKIYLYLLAQNRYRSLHHNWYARWQAEQDDRTQLWSQAYTRLLRVPVPGVFLPVVSIACPPMNAVTSDRKYSLQAATYTTWSTTRIHSRAASVLSLY